MSQGMRWRYCTKEQCRELLASYDLFQGLGWSAQEQERCLYSLSNHAKRHYRAVEIPKKSGGIRKLMVPDPILSKVQKRILHGILDEMPISDYAKAYKKGGRLTENALPHRGKRRILKLDIRDFFGNITFTMVYQSVFCSLRFPPAVGTLLTNLCCCGDVLPQGAPTSPAISNLVMRPFDDYMGEWCARQNVGYTRYCDDMTFSGDFSPDMVRRKVKGFMTVMGFELNEKKTAVQERSQRQTVTGIVVNEKGQAAREYRKNLRQEVYYCQRFGVEEHLKRRRGKTEETPRSYLSSLEGKLRYVLQVNPNDTQARADLEVIQRLALSCDPQPSRAAWETEDGGVTSFLCAPAPLERQRGEPGQ